MTLGHRNPFFPVTTTLFGLSFFSLGQVMIAFWRGRGRDWIPLFFCFLLFFSISFFFSRPYKADLKRVGDGSIDPIYGGLIILFFFFLTPCMTWYDVVRKSLRADLCLSLYFYYLRIDVLLIFFYFFIFDMAVFLWDLVFLLDQEKAACDYMHMTYMTKNVVWSIIMHKCWIAFWLLRSRLSIGLYNNYIVWVLMYSLGFDIYHGAYGYHRF